MPLKTITLEHWLDIRDAMKRELERLTTSRMVTEYGNKERARKVNSLNESIEQIDKLIQTLK